MQVKGCWAMESMTQESRDRQVIDKIRQTYKPELKQSLQTGGKMKLEVIMCNWAG